MNKLEIAGTYLATLQGKEYIILVKGSSPMLRVVSAFELTRYIETGELAINDEIVQQISQDPLLYNYRPLDIVTTVAVKASPKIDNIEYKEKDFKKWIESSKTLDEAQLTSLIMLAGKFTYAQTEIILKRIWKERKMSLR